MKKIPTIFTRVFGNHQVIDIKEEITPGCEEAFLHGIATVKIDGACCAIIGGELYRRYDAKNGKKPPEGAIPCCDPDSITGQMYNSPITLYETAVQTIMEERENAIFAKVQSTLGVDVDKAELIRALQYDRGQYDKGYRDGFHQAANQVRSYLVDLIEEWNELGDRKYDLPNMQVYNHIRKELDDLEAYIEMHCPNGDCK